MCGEIEMFMVGGSNERIEEVKSKSLAGNLCLFNSLPKRES